MPIEYQPQYAYPLVVVLHDTGSDPWEPLAHVPALSSRNYIVVCPRGSLALPSDAFGRPRYAWSDNPTDEIAYLRRLLEAAYRHFPHLSQSLHVVSIGHSAAVAVRLAVQCQGLPVGLILLHPPADSLVQLPASSLWPDLRIFVSYPTWLAPPLSFRRHLTRSLTQAGVMLQWNAFPYSTPYHPEVLRQVNRWIMEAVAVRDNRTVSFSKMVSHRRPVIPLKQV
ncbi:MAG: hypothetical protein NZ703_01850 [Gemmataceae bacterium]|nr:hypothetical protein [Gemmataceae bacterium]